jgi:hypothetical protein
MSVVTAHDLVAAQESEQLTLRELEKVEDVI